MSRWPITVLKKHISEVSVRKGNEAAEILSVTNTEGFVRSLEVFDKQVYSQDASNYKLVRFNDLAYNPSRINVGSVARCQFPDGGAVSPMYVVVRCRESLHPQFLLYFLKSDVGRLHINHRTVGAVRFQLRFGDLKQIEIPLPPSAEQMRIVKLLDEAEALQRLRREADGRTDTLIAAVFREMFGDPSINPKAWQMERVGDLILMCEYGTSRKASETGQGIPILRMNNVRTDGSLDLSDLKTVELAEAERAKFRLEEGDVLFNRTNSRELVGKTGLWDGRFEAVAASYFIRVRFDPDREHPQHFTTFMNLPFMKQQLRKIARGAVGQANINAQELKAIQIPVPPIELQRIFAARVDEIRELQSAQAANLQRLDDLFQSLLHRAFQGEL